MRGADERGEGLFSYVDLEAPVPAYHPLRAIQVLVDEALAALSADFASLYSKTRRPSIAPEKLLRALLLQVFYTIRSERQLCYMGHLLMENRNALIVDEALTRAGGAAEREAALAMPERQGKRRRITLGANKAYAVAGFVDAPRDHGVTPHIAVDGRLGKTRKPRDPRPAHRPPSRLRRQPEVAQAHQAHRGGVRLDQDHRRAGQNPASRAQPGGLDVRAHLRRLQSGPVAQAAIPRRRHDASRSDNTPPHPPSAGRKPQPAPPPSREIPPNRTQLVAFSVACWGAFCNSASPPRRAGLERIAQHYRIEEKIGSDPPAKHRTIRRKDTGPLVKLFGV